MSEIDSDSEELSRPGSHSSLFPDPVRKRKIPTPSSFHSSPFSPAVSKGNLPILPVVMSAVGQKSFFRSLSFANLKQFVVALECLVKSVKNVRVAIGGDLFVTPVDQAQKSALLSLTSVASVNVLCSKTRSEADYKGVITGVPASEVDCDEILSSLKDQNVTHVRRINKKVEGVLVPTTALVLTFAEPPPFRVSLAYRSFVVRMYMPSPMQCANCHRVGHTENHCRFSPRCASCGKDHVPEAPCGSPAKCINCLQSSHTTGSPECPTFISHQRVLKHAKSNNISVVEAQDQINRLSTPSSLPSLSNTVAWPAVSTRDNELEDLQKKFAALESKVDSLAVGLQPLLVLKDSVGSLTKMVTSMTSKIDALSAMSSAVSELQKEFSLFSSMMAPADESEMDVEPSKPKLCVKSSASSKLVPLSLSK